MNPSAFVFGKKFISCPFLFESSVLVSVLCLPSAMVCLVSSKFKSLNAVSNSDSVLYFVVSTLALCFKTILESLLYCIGLPVKSKIVSFNKELVCVLTIISVTFVLLSTDGDSFCLSFVWITGVIGVCGSVILSIVVLKSFIITADCDSLLIDNGFLLIITFGSFTFPI